MDVDGAGGGECQESRVDFAGLVLTKRRTMFDHDVRIRKGCRLRGVPQVAVTLWGEGREMSKAQGSCKQDDIHRSAQRGYRRARSQSLLLTVRNDIIVLSRRETNTVKMGAQSDPVSSLGQVDNAMLRSRLRH